MFDTVIVGAGFSGAVLAERLATQLHHKVLVLDKRNHIGGNAYDFVNRHGIRISQYGAHLFHTQRQDVWDYIQQFAHWTPWEHRVLARIPAVNTTTYSPIPICLGTFQSLNLAHNISQMKEYVKKETELYAEHAIKTSRDVALARVGSHLYELFFRHYTIKQWAKEPYQLAPSVLQRIPLRFNDDDRYFTDTYQALPTHGYTALFDRLLSHPGITVRTGTDYFSEEHCLKGIETVFFTGAIDRYYAFAGLPKLEYRSIRFENEEFTLDSPDEYILPASVVNEPSPDVPYTRTVEHKRFLHQKGWVSTVTREYTTSDGEPYYPVPNEENQRLYEQYRDLANQESKKQKRNIIFLGRLAGYKYMNMDEAIGNALDVFKDYEKRRTS